jgi:hypothetical protein
VRQGREGREGEREVRAVGGGVIRERDRESRRGVKNGGTHILEVEMEGLQEWRVREGIWRGMQNGGLFRGPAGVEFLHKTSKFCSRGLYRGPHWSCSYHSNYILLTSFPFEYFTNYLTMAVHLYFFLVANKTMVTSPPNADEQPACDI